MNHKCDEVRLATLLPPKMVKIRPFSTSIHAAENSHVLATKFQQHFKRPDEADGHFPYTETDDRLPQVICSCCWFYGENKTNCAAGLVLSPKIERITVEISDAFSMPSRHPYNKKYVAKEAVEAVRDHCTFLHEVALWSDFFGFSSNDTKWWNSDPIGQVELYATWVIFLKQYSAKSETYDQVDITDGDVLAHHRYRLLCFGKFLIGRDFNNINGVLQWSIDEGKNATKVLSACYNDLRGKETCWSPLSRLRLEPNNEVDTHADTTEGKTTRQKKKKYMIVKDRKYIPIKSIERKLINILNAVLHTLEKFRNDAKYKAKNEWFYTEKTQTSFGQMLEDNLVRVTLDSDELLGEGCLFFNKLSNEEMKTAKDMLRNVAKRFAFMYRVQVRSYRDWSIQTE